MTISPTRIIDYRKAEWSLASTRQNICLALIWLVSLYFTALSVSLGLISLSLWYPDDPSGLNTIAIVGGLLACLTGFWSLYLLRRCKRAVIVFAILAMPVLLILWPLMIANWFDVYAIFGYVLPQGAITPSIHAAIMFVMLFGSGFLLYVPAWFFLRRSNFPQQSKMIIPGGNTSRGREISRLLVLVTGGCLCLTVTHDMLFRLYDIGGIIGFSGRPLSVSLAGTWSLGLIAGIGLIAGWRWGLIGFSLEIARRAGGAWINPPEVLAPLIKFHGPEWQLPPLFWIPHDIKSQTYILVFLIIVTVNSKYK
ncbi:MAG: hypothetical protein JKY49_14420 [Cohaesibacteraceae bacterium]|nr:hypothetical protein [Cohaesibacteraceae bacterium]